MMSFRVRGLPETVSDEVRHTRRSPRYGHPVLSEPATGTGPCRSCLGLFALDADERLLFTYGPPSGVDAVPAPGPVFIHAEPCMRYDECELPVDLRSLPLLLEGRTEAGTVTALRPAAGKAADDALERLLANPDVDFVFIRHGEAGCHIARVDRV